nr:Conserved hypothetical protein [Haemonchus contortus]
MCDVQSFDAENVVTTPTDGHQDISTVDAQMLDELTRVRLLLHRLDATAYGKCSNYILPGTQRDVTFEEAVSTLMSLFGPQQSLFGRRYACMKLTKDPNDDFVTYDVSTVNAPSSG